MPVVAMSSVNAFMQQSMPHPVHGRFGGSCRGLLCWFSPLE